jgi:hypothetical protein
MSVPRVDSGPFLIGEPRFCNRSEEPPNDRLKITKFF